MLVRAYLSFLAVFVAFLLLPPPPSVITSPSAGLIARAPILIEGNSGFTPTNGVTGGLGTNASPYVVSGWFIGVFPEVGIEVRNTTAPFVLRDVEVDGSFSYNLFAIGILLSNVTDATIERVSSSNADSGLRVEGARRLTISNSTFNGRGHSAILTNQSGDFGPSIRLEDIAIADSTFYGGLFAGVTVASGSHLTVARCRFEGSVQGLFVWGSEDVSLRENHLRNTSTGISLIGSSRVRLEDNRIEGGDFPGDTSGAELSSTSDVILVRNEIREVTWGLVFRMNIRFPGHSNAPFLAYHNNLLGSAANMSGAAPNRTWDGGYPNGGNYWSAYVGLDSCRGPNQDDCSNRDGMADTPRVWVTDSGTAVDRYPLIRPYPLPSRPPVANAVVGPSGGATSTAFIFNASASYDSRDPLSLLQFRWDWEGDGLWDTDWSSDPHSQHVFGAPGIYRVSLEVRNTAGLTNQTTVEVQVRESVIQRLVDVWPIFPIVAVAVGTIVVWLWLQKGRRRTPPDQGA